jgi:hypothetical protein
MFSLKNVYHVNVRHSAASLFFWLLHSKRSQLVWIFIYFSMSECNLFLAACCQRGSIKNAGPKSIFPICSQQQLTKHEVNSLCKKPDAFLRRYKMLLMFCPPPAALYLHLVRVVPGNCTAAAKILLFIFVRANRWPERPKRKTRAHLAVPGRTALLQLHT